MGNIAAMMSARAAPPQQDARCPVCGEMQALYVPQRCASQGCAHSSCLSCTRQHFRTQFLDRERIAPFTCIAPGVQSHELTLLDCIRLFPDVLSPQVGRVVADHAWLICRRVWLRPLNLYNIARDLSSNLLLNIRLRTIDWLETGQRLGSSLQLALVQRVLADLAIALASTPGVPFMWIFFGAIPKGIFYLIYSVLVAMRLGASVSGVAAFLGTFLLYWTPIPTPLVKCLELYIAFAVLLELGSLASRAARCSDCLAVGHALLDPVWSLAGDVYHPLRQYARVFRNYGEYVCTHHVPRPFGGVLNPALLNSDFLGVDRAVANGLVEYGMLLTTTGAILGLTYSFGGVGVRQAVVFFASSPRWLFFLAASSSPLWMDRAVAEEAHGEAAWRVLIQDELYFERTCVLCPHCQVRVERIVGCSSMVCGKDFHNDDANGRASGGCNRPFDFRTAQPYVTNLRSHPLFQRYPLSNMMDPRLAFLFVLHDQGAAVGEAGGGQAGGGGGAEVPSPRTMGRRRENIAPAQAARFRPPAPESECVICMAAPRTHAFMPCGHRCVCEQDALAALVEDEPRCPICRGAIASVSAIYD